MAVSGPVFREVQKRKLSLKHVKQNEDPAWVLASQRVRARPCTLSNKLALFSRRQIAFFQKDAKNARRICHKESVNSVFTPNRLECDDCMARAAGGVNEVTACKRVQ